MKDKVEEVDDKMNGKENYSLLLKKILYLLLEKKIKPGEFWELYRENNNDFEKTFKLLKKYRNLKLNITDTKIGSDSEKDFSSNNNYPYLAGYRRVMEGLHGKEFEVLTFEDEKYPPLLRLIYYPPLLLFYKGGKIKESRFNLAIVGTRKCSPYGAEVAKYMSRELSRIGVTIVSGLASGIDSYAHKEAIKEKGGSIGVLGCGIDVIYPEENRSLYEEMIGNGSLVSEFFPGMPPLKSNFPLRNRIISGLCHGVIVIEATEKSGAIITCDHALNQNREVFAVPGSIFSSQSRGCHRLIREGAKLVQDVDDVLEEFSHLFAPEKKLEDEGEKGKAGEKTFTNSASNSCSNLPGLCNGSLAGGATNSTTFSLLFKKLGKEHKKVYDALGCKAMNLEEIVGFTKLEVKRVVGILSDLELENLIEESSFNRYRKLV